MARGTGRGRDEDADGVLPTVLVGEAARALGIRWPVAGILLWEEVDSPSRGRLLDVDRDIPDPGRTAGVTASDLLLLLVRPVPLF